MKDLSCSGTAAACAATPGTANAATMATPPTAAAAHFLILAIIPPVKNHYAVGIPTRSAAEASVNYYRTSGRWSEIRGITRGIQPPPILESLFPVHRAGNQLIDADGSVTDLFNPRL
ncbi:hypothetical protein [Saccharopolyspora hattusasensis]|uniref:hypothetical protein n=1 Tax=Saccharopolyspora hattusasensis TaxID=1128679 RepID=UPI003D96E2ED